MGQHAPSDAYPCRLASNYKQFLVFFPHLTIPLFLVRNVVCREILHREGLALLWLSLVWLLTSHVEISGRSCSVMAAAL